MKKYIFTLMVSSLLFACNKEAGEGGTSSIEGKVFVNDINGSGELQAQFFGQDEDVFIIYGNTDQTYDENMSTSLDGSFRFDNLTVGEYTIFAYSRCDTCASGTEAIKKTVEISEKKTVYSAGTIEIFK